MAEENVEIKDLPEKVKKTKKVKKPVVKPKKMSLTKEERVGIILLCGSRSLRQTAEDFNKANPHREKITHSCVSKLLAKFWETGSIRDKPKIAKKRVTDEATSLYILAKFSMNPSSSIRRMALETNVSKTSIRRILRANRVVTTSTIGQSSTGLPHNYGEFNKPANQPGTAAPAKKKAAPRPRKPSAAKVAATAAAAANCITNSMPNSGSTDQQQLANKWHQQQQQQLQPQQLQQQQLASTSDGHNYGYMSDYKEMAAGDYMSQVPSVNKSPKAHKPVTTANNNWNASAVSYGYGAPLMYPSAIGYIDPSSTQ